MWRSFRERVNFLWIWFRNLRIRCWGLEIKHNLVRQGCFFISRLIISRLRRSIELKFSQVCYYLWICWDTPSETTGLSLAITNSVHRFKPGCTYREPYTLPCNLVYHSLRPNSTQKTFLEEYLFLSEDCHWNDSDVLRLRFCLQCSHSKAATVNSCTPAIRLKVTV